MATSTTNINDTFFKGIYLEVWRKLIPPGLSEAECDFIQDVAQLQKGDAILDLMCGYGRHTLELARRGFVTTGIDNSEAYINEVKLAASKENLSVEAINARVLDARLSKIYKAVICMGNSFAFFDRTDAIRLLQKISDHLDDDGVFIINSWMVAEIAIKHFREKEWFAVDGYKYLLDYKFAFRPSRIESEHTIVSASGEVEVIHGVDYIFTLAEMETMFQQVELTTKAYYSTPRKRPFVMGDNRIYIVAEKRQ